MSLSVETVIRVVADYYQLPTARLCGKERYRPIAHARHVAMYLTRSLCEELAGVPLSFPKIGRAFGWRDHTTAMAAHFKIKTALAHNEPVRRQVRELNERLKAHMTPYADLTGTPTIRATFAEQLSDFEIAVTEGLARTGT